MADEHDLRREINEAQSARKIIDNPLWDEVWDRLETNVIREWMSTPLAATDKRESLYRQLTTARAVRKDFERTATTGLMAAMEMEAREHE